MAKELCWQTYRIISDKNKIVEKNQFTGDKYIGNNLQIHLKAEKKKLLD